MTCRSLILGSGAYLPERILTNGELAERIDTSDAWIVERTGIRERRIAGEGERPRTWRCAPPTPPYPTPACVPTRSI